MIYRAAANVDQDTIVEQLREDIHAGQLLPGQLVSVRVLAERFGVSRSVMSDALHRLAATGVVTIEPSRGVRITITTPNDVAEVFQMRLQLEVPAAFRAATRIAQDMLNRLERQLRFMASFDEDASRVEFMKADIEFHDLVLRAAGNDRLAATVRSLRHAVVAQQVLTSRPIKGIMREHEPILRALRKGDALGARAAMHRHILSTGRTLIREYATNNTMASPSILTDWTEGLGEADAGAT